jgi:endonuclease/exonuclease/phosphatase family metal-dependent hydrolase
VRELASGQLGASDHERVLVMGDLNDGVEAATTQILNGPTGSEIGTVGFDRADARRGKPGSDHTPIVATFTL